MRRSVGRGTILLALVWACLLLPDAAGAHSRLVTSSPPPGASLESAPGAIEISLSEAVSLDFSSVLLLDRERRELPVGKIGYGVQGESSVRVPIDSELPPGTYGVVWQVVSAVDGHLTTGSFVFRVLEKGENPGSAPDPVLLDPGAPGAALEAVGERPDALHWLVRALVLVCITFCLGGAIFLVLVIEPVVTQGSRTGEQLWPVLTARFAEVGSFAAAALLPLLVLDLLSQVAAIGQTDLEGALRRADLGGLLLATTRYGFAWTMKILAALALAGLFLFVRMRRKGGSGLWETGIAAGSLFLLSESLSSHAAAVQGESVAGLPLPVISDWVHLVTASTWIGGLLFLIVVLFPGYRRAGIAREERAGFLAAAVPRFSKLALASVMALGVSGTYNLAIQTTDLAAIGNSLYGQVVALKVVLFLALIAIGAINLAYLSPRLGLASAPSGEGTVSRFRRNVRLEVGLVMLVLLCAGGLTLLPPPSDASPAAVASTGGLSLPTPTSPAATPTSVAPRGPATASTAVADTPVLLEVEQVEAEEVFSVTLGADRASAVPHADVTRLVLMVSPQGLDVGSTVLAAELRGETAGGAQLWVARGAVLAFAGRYMVTTVAQRSANADLKAAFLMTLSESGDLSLEATGYVEARIRTEPEPPVVGSNTVIVALRGAEGEPVAGAEVHLGASGPQGRLLEPQVLLEPVPGAPGDYTVRLDFPVPGAWILQVSVSRKGQPDLRFTASVDVIEASKPEPTP